ncbi:asparagine synthase [Parashewanella spongiae]|uniref:Asparagine synthase n=1 Tax=Parashewanella spongiae TaxID=342950 RepID=A0A3A6T2S3_9GAMM|nr:asparagine synthase C-terminal domain-containing protein [Parashewanella spongiae]MCL1080195.1 asparagine synthase C-terminal domain-containing protein [Parashewanella spongiae]RJY02157.1 asparagine synthase [Parashewanella spongiae]
MIDQFTASAHYPKYNLITSLNNAVKNRLPEVQKPVGIFLSGGLDSSIIAALASKLRPNITYFTLGNESSSDKAMVTKLVKHLELNDVRIIPVPSDELLGSYIAKIVYVTESVNPSIISNGLATYLLAQAASYAGIKVVLTGEGADELFGGYFKYLEPNVLKIKCSNLMADMQYTELRRLDLCTMAHGVEARCPFLDNEIINLSKELEFSDIYSESMNKVILRKSFSSYLPKEVTDRPKVSFDVGSGIRQMVVKYLKRNGRSEREELQEIWEQHFNRTSTNDYFHRYSVFDDAIDRRGSSHQ